MFNKNKALGVSLVSLLAVSLFWWAYAAEPLAISVKYNPVNVEVISSPLLPAAAQAEEARTAQLLFDRDTTTEHVAFDASQFITQFETVTAVTHIKVHGAAPYTLSVEADIAGSYQPIPGLLALDLSLLPSAWIAFPIASPVPTTKLRFTLLPVAGSTATGLKEIEVWGAGYAINARDGQDILARIDAGVLLPHVKVLPAVNPTATPTEGVIGPLTGDLPDDPADNTFTFNLTTPPSQAVRAYLTYETVGINHWVEAVRTINGVSPQSGLITQTGTDWSTQVERIKPESLILGENTLTFAVPEGVTTSYTVRNIRILLELENGTNVVDEISANQPDLAGTNPASAIYDGDLTTGWKPYPDDQAITSTAPIIEFKLNKPYQIDGVGFYLSAAISGRMGIELLQNGIWSTLVEESGSVLTTGWNQILIQPEVPYELRLIEGFRLTFFEGVESISDIKEIVLIGSGVGPAYNPPQFKITYPEKGEFFGRDAYVRGFIDPVDNGSGAAQLFIAGLPVPHTNGNFDHWINKNDAGFTQQGDEEEWSADIVATYPDGENVTRTINFDAQQFTIAPVDGIVVGEKAELVTVAETVDHTIIHDEAQLDVTTGSLETDTTITIKPLKDTEMPALDAGMTNVTKGPRRGYRFLPHGSKFKKNLKVKLKYNKALLPPGSTEQDIKTFYFDEEAGVWKELERVLVDTTSQTVESLTDHFTDMINATVTVPDSPLAASFNPTQIKDIKAADPGAGINLIEPPKANNMGDARVSYPIEIPPGRQGMQPQLSVNYNSSGGNGWMGLGWDMPMQTITVDTRWGVPRYDAASETETYTLAGEQLTPVAHRGELIPRTTDKIFHARVEGSFRKIIRHGSTPQTYWWEVIDKNGTRYFYGGGPDKALPTRNSTLVDGSGNIYKWSLRVTLDTNGNFVKYNCERFEDVGVQGGSVIGTQLYLKTINYTGYTDVDTDFSNVGPFQVTFVKDSEVLDTSGIRINPQRRDINIDARGGFKMVTGELLNNINVDKNGEIIRSYVFSYREGAFAKQLLQDVTQLDTVGTLFNKHTFDYHDEIRDQNGAYQGYAGSENWDTGIDNVTAGLLDSGHASALSGTYSRTTGGHLYVGFNVFQGQKKFSIGGKVGYSETDSEGRLTMIDINGDGLPDKVFKDGGMKYRPNESGPDGTTTFGAPVELKTLHDFTRENSSMTSHGPEIFFGVSAGSNSSNTFTQSSIYFSDVNGDGLMDVVRGGQVLFNRLINGVPTFASDSSQTPYPIGSGAVDAENIIEDYEAIYQQNIDTFPLLDSVRRWVAPFNGVVNITGDVALIEDTSQARALYTTADGVRVAMQHNASELWSSSIGATDYAQKTPTGTTGISVSAGDIIYFRVQSSADGSTGADGAYDQVSWSPTIAYQNVTATTDVNGLNPYVYTPSTDFTLAGRRGITSDMPLNGVIRITGTLQKLAATSDDIELQIIKNGDVQYSSPLLASQIQDIVVNQDITVAATDDIAIRVVINSPVDVTKLSWLESNPLKLFFISSPDVAQLQDGDGKYLVQLNPPYDYDLYPDSNQSSPLQAWTATQTGSLTVIPNLSTGVDDTSTSGDVYVTVKQQNALVAKQKITFTNGGRSGGSFIVNVVAGQQYFFEFSALDQRLKPLLFGKSITLLYSGDDPDLDGISVASEFHAGAVQNVLPQSYRGWNVFGYNGNRDRASNPISVTAADFFVDENYNPANARVTPYYPQSESLPVFPTSRWDGGDPNAWVNATTISSSRSGQDYIDVPRSSNFAGSRGVARLSRSSQGGEFLGVSFLSGSSGSGSSYSQVDFMDLNGDRFPDILGNARVQFTNMVGGLEVSSSGMPGYGSKPRDTANTSANAGIGASMSQLNSNSEGTGSTSGYQMPPIGFGASISEGTTNNNFDLMDINGDGLADRVSQSGSDLIVALNLGYSFATPENWKAATISSTTSDGTNVSLGYNGGIFDFGGGLSLATSDSKSSASLIDINGDGLVDRVYNSGGNISVGFNTGNGFLQNVIYNGGFGQGFTKNVSETLGGGAYYTYGIGPLCWPTSLCYIIINPGVNTDEAMAAQELSIRDIDGDGYPDQLASTVDSQVTVQRNRVGRTNLLSKVNRPLGASFTISYDRSGNTYKQPQSRWVMGRVEVNDGFAGDGVDIQLSTYKYAEGFHNREEREFYGYETVIEEHRNITSTEDLYRSITQTFLNNSYYSKGLVKVETVADAAGLKFTETENNYLLRDINTGLALVDNQSLTATVFPELSRTDKRFYEGLGNTTPGKSTYTIHEYDVLGNIVGFFDAADTGAQDDVEATIAYFNDAANYIVGKPNSITVLGNGVLMRQRDSVLQPGTGNTTQVNLHLETGPIATTDITYDDFGNIKTKVGPANSTGQRFSISYTYDAEVNTYVERVDDTSFGYYSTATYDNRWGKVLTTVDINAQPMSYTYDNVGRSQTIKGPYEQTASAGNETISFSYAPEATIPYALTRHLDRNPDNSIKSDRIETVLFTDGLKRVLQTKKDAAIYLNGVDTSTDKMIVSGRVTFDFVGRSVEQRYPTEQALGQQSVFVTLADSVQATVMEYDVLDRNTKTTIPDNTSTSINYGFGTDRVGTNQFQTTITDSNGVKKYSFRDVRDVITAVKEENNKVNFSSEADQIIWTSYKYDPLKQILEVKDDHGKITSVVYDNFGRRTKITNPDTGLVETVYDTASNVISRITPNLRASGENISYTYDYTRLKAITYPNSPKNNVAYTYGVMATSYNRANRIITAISEAGIEERFYGQLGEVVKTIHTIVTETTPNEPEVYTSLYSYDTWNRLRDMTYPDGEKLTYEYNSGGLLNKADGVKDSYRYSYIRKLEYDKFEQRKFILNGNNTQSNYAYDPLDRRLFTLRSGKGNGNQFQSLSYTYDDVGNITQLANSAAITSSSQLGGASSQTFVYDDLYRLVNAAGTFDTQPTGKQHAYSLNMVYDTNHNIKSKQQLHTVRQPSGTLITQKKTSYNWNYGYLGAQPHAPTDIGNRKFSYDVNGNQTGWTHNTNGTRRTIVWDEENRIQSIADNGHSKTYTYNDSGERVIKRGPQGETVYVNQYFTMRNGEIGTKHVYAGISRVVSKMMKQDKPGANPKGRTPKEKDLYFYHPDHLGSSSYITDASGKLYQHLEYFPFGETWIEESSNTQRTPYLFTAKELDEETGLYYFGARYYDPRTSVWQSADPILGSYLGVDASKLSNAGVFNPANLGLYSYTFNNPVMYIDPSGEEPISVTTAVVGGSLLALGAGVAVVIGQNPDYQRNMSGVLNAMGDNFSNNMTALGDFVGGMFNDSGDVSEEDEPFVDELKGSTEEGESGTRLKGDIDELADIVGGITGEGGLREAQDVFEKSRDSRKADPNRTGPNGTLDKRHKDRIREEGKILDGIKDKLKEFDS